MSCGSTPRGKPQFTSPFARSWSSRPMLKLLLIGLLLTPSAFSAESPCAEVLGHCSYYSCQEQQHQCGDEGYYLAFGKEYCERYDAEAPFFGIEGQNWLPKVRDCLQLSLELSPERASCSNVRAFSILKHLDCYLETGFCDLPPLDQLHVYAVAADQFGVPDLMEFFKNLQSACRATRRP